MTPQEFVKELGWALYFREPSILAGYNLETKIIANIKSLRHDPESDALFIEYVEN